MPAQCRRIGGLVGPSRSLENISEHGVLSRGRAERRKRRERERSSGKGKGEGKQIFRRSSDSVGSLFYFHLATTRRTTKLLKCWTVQASHKWRGRAHERTGERRVFQRARPKISVHFHVEAQAPFFTASPGHPRPPPLDPELFKNSKTRRGLHKKCSGRDCRGSEGKRQRNEDKRRGGKAEGERRREGFFQTYPWPLMIDAVVLFHSRLSFLTRRWVHREIGRLCMSRQGWKRETSFVYNSAINRDVGNVAARLKACLFAKLND